MDLQGILNTWLEVARDVKIQRAVINGTPIDGSVVNGLKSVIAAFIKKWKPLFLADSDQGVNLETAVSRSFKVQWTNNHGMIAGYSPDASLGTGGKRKPDDQGGNGNAKRQQQNTDLNKGLLKLKAAANGEVPRGSFRVRHHTSGKKVWPCHGYLFHGKSCTKATCTFGHVDRGNCTTDDRAAICQYVSSNLDKVEWAPGQAPPGGS